MRHTPRPAAGGPAQWVCVRSDTARRAAGPCGPERRVAAAVAVARLGRPHRAVPVGRLLRNGAVQGPDLAGFPRRDPGRVLRRRRPVRTAARRVAGAHSGGRRHGGARSRSRRRPRSRSRSRRHPGHDAVLVVPARLPRRARRTEPAGDRAAEARREGRPRLLRSARRRRDRRRDRRLRRAVPAVRRADVLPGQPARDGRGIVACTAVVAPRDRRTRRQRARCAARSVLAVAAAPGLAADATGPRRPERRRGPRRVAGRRGSTRATGHWPGTVPRPAARRPGTVAGPPPRAATVTCRWPRRRRAAPGNSLAFRPRRADPALATCLGASARVCGLRCTPGT